MRKHQCPFATIHGRLIHAKQFGHLMLRQVWFGDQVHVKQHVSLPLRQLNWSTPQVQFDGEGLPLDLAQSNSNVCSCEPVDSKFNADISPLVAIDHVACLVHDDRALHADGFNRKLQIGTLLSSRRREDTEWVIHDLVLSVSRILAFCQSEKVRICTGKNQNEGPAGLMQSHQSRVKWGRIRRGAVTFRALGDVPGAPSAACRSAALSDRLAPPVAPTHRKLRRCNHRVVVFG